jgi:hypothetical protein
MSAWLARKSNTSGRTCIWSWNPKVPEGSVSGCAPNVRPNIGQARRRLDTNQAPMRVCSSRPPPRPRVVTRNPQQAVRFLPGGGDRPVVSPTSSPSAASCAVATLRAMARTCMFCGGRPLTAEHAWPAWLRETLPNVPGGLWVRWDTVGTDADVRQWPANEIDVRVRWVCRPCNSGWMSRLEARAKPALAPMIRGQATTLDQPEQLLVATWATKTAMVLEFLKHESSAASADDRAWVRRYDSPPPTARVRIARYVGDLEPLNYLHITGYDPSGPAGKPNLVYATTR